MRLCKGCLKKYNIRRKVMRYNASTTEYYNRCARGYAAFTAYLRSGKCISFFRCFSVFNDASCCKADCQCRRIATVTTHTFVRRLRIARVFLGRRSRGAYFFFLYNSLRFWRAFWFITVMTRAMDLRTVLLHS